MLNTLWRIAYEAGYGYFANRLSTSAAAMAFYTMFALGPIMIFVIAIAEPIVGRLMAQEAIFNALSTVVAPEQLQSIRRFLSRLPTIFVSQLPGTCVRNARVYNNRMCIAPALHDFFIPEHRGCLYHI